MPASPFFRRDHDDDLAIAIAAEDMSLADQSPFLPFADDKHSFDSALPDSDHNMIFEFDDAFDAKPRPHNAYEAMAWDVPHQSTMSFFPGSPESTSSQLEYGAPHLGTADRSFASSALNSYDVPSSSLADFNYSHWIADPDAPPAPPPSAPIDIPFTPSQSSAASSFATHSDASSIFPDVSPFSPTTAYAALQPLPRSYSPGIDPSMTGMQSPHEYSMSPPDPSFSPPTWASQLWQPSSPAQPVTTPAMAISNSSLSPTEDAFATQRPRASSARKSFTPLADVFVSSSAPSMSNVRPSMSRAYSRRAESISEHDDRDATVRRKKRSLVTDDEDHRPAERGETPARSLLRPPKLAPSAWQLYFTDWIQRHQATSSKKLNVAQAAKEAGQEYAKLSSEEKEPYKRQSQALKEAREREHAAYMRTLTPEDIKRENAFRTAQRKAGKSRRGNIKDPNAPKKPLSAYFMFLQRIRADPDLVREVFGDETETTKQSVLAAAKWRSMTDDERKPFLAQAEQEKLEYEAARKLYEEGTTGYSSSINFSVLSGTINSIAFPSSSTFLRPLKQEAQNSESEAEDDAASGTSSARARSRS
ncbi:hypothetical protein EIP86_011383 [Pleurotus ostreatoroseus]|nr:hypothetical protein EIP86_011383 [Pleurotus ostreatoroseus]